MTTADKIDSYLADGKFPESTFNIILDDGKHYLGGICKRGHEYDGSGKSVRGKSHRNCMICMRLNAFVWGDTNRERSRAYSKAYEATEIGKARKKRNHEKWRKVPTNKISVMIRSALARSRATGVAFDITQEFMTELFSAQDGACYWTGVKLNFEGAARHPLKPSIDRLVPKDGYTKGNVVWASNFANRARGDMPADEFHDVVSIVSQHAFGRQPPIWCHTN